MRSSGAIRLVVLIATVAAVLPWRAGPALALVEGASDNYFGTGAGANDAGGDHNNSFFGGLAGNTNISGVNNAFFGLQAGRFNATGSDNTFVGVNAGLNNTTPCCNAFFGHNAGLSNTDGAVNAFFGDRAGTSNTDGSLNAFFGQATGAANTTGDSNAFFGQFAGFENTTGNENAFFGQNAGRFNTTESANTFVGAVSIAGVAGLTNATAVGHRTQVSQSDSLVLGSIAGLNGATQSVKVGIGTTAPKAPLHVVGNIIGGSSANALNSGVVGSSILGGGSPGSGNRVTDSFGVVAGGLANQAGDAGGTVGDRAYATVSGGALNRATNVYSTVPGGLSNTAGGFYALAAGRRAKAMHQGSFVWADSQNFDMASTATNQFTARATGGVRFVSGVNASGVPTAGVSLAPGSGTWSSLSDRKAKANVKAVDAQAVLHALSTLDISSWNYRAQDPSVRHMGPMAQDFTAAFGIGEDDKHITTVDADGVALASIQGLYELVQSQAERIKALERAGSE